MILFISFLNCQKFIQFFIGEKQLAWHSWRVNVNKKYEKIKEPSEDEVSLKAQVIILIDIDVLYSLEGKYKDQCTRMSCQIIISKDMEGAEIAIPRSAFSIFDKFDDDDFS